MKRRKFLKSAVTAGAVATVSAASSLPKPALSQGIKQLKVVSMFPKNFPGLGTSISRVVDRINRAADGKLDVKLYNAGELVGAMEVFDVVSKGDAEIYFGSEYYFLGKHKALAFFAAVPFGLSSVEYFAWLNYGGGQELWDEISGNYNLKPFTSFNTGVQMGGWLNKEINSVDDFKGIKFRMPGLGGEVLRRMGAAVVSLHGGEIFQALQSGAIDASEWVGPWHDLAFGFYKITKYYYWPGFHEPSSTTSYAVNLKLWEKLPADQKELITMAFQAETHLQTSEFEARNPDALDTLLNKHKVQMRKYPEDIVKQMAEISFDVVSEVGGTDAVAKKVWDSYRTFNDKAVKWTGFGLQAFLNSRSKYRKS